MLGHRIFWVIVPMSRYVYIDTLPNHTGIFWVIVPMSRHVHLDTLPSHIGFHSLYYLQGWFYNICMFRRKIKNMLMLMYAKSKVQIAHIEVGSGFIFSSFSRVLIKKSGYLGVRTSLYVVSHWSACSVFLSDQLQSLKSGFGFVDHMSIKEGSYKAYNATCTSRVFLGLKLSDCVT